VSAELARGPLTDAVIALLAELGKPVGDGVLPADAGWQGQLNAPGSTFVPYLVVATLTAARSSGSLGAPQSEWQVPYSVQSYGATRAQAEWMADQARTALAGMRGQVYQLGARNFKVLQAWTTQIAGVNRVDTVQPPVWGQPDQVTLWLTERQN
jgi:hypothetical protein